MANEHGKYSGAGKLRVYHLALEFCELLEQLMPRVVCTASLRDQIARASDSVLLNIAEGAAHYSPGRKVYHYQLAHGSVAECLAAVARLRNRNATVDMTRIRQKGEMITLMLLPLIESQRARKA